MEAFESYDTQAPLKSFYVFISKGKYLHRL